MMNTNVPQSDQPTGFVPTALPFWEQMDDGVFEQFCTDLLNLHPILRCLRDGQVVERRVVSAARLLSGTSQRGADIRAEMEQGEVWYFQCKRVKSFGPADIAEAANLAERELSGADQYILITTCGLSEKGQQVIAARTKWFWWDSSRLTTEVQKIQPTESGMNLVHRFFGRDWVKELFPWGDQPLLTWQEFFVHDLSGERQLFHHRMDFVPCASVFERLEDFAQNGGGRVLVLSAAGGQGKSRLLLQLAQKFENQPGMPRVRFLNLSRDSLTEEQTDFLGREKDLLLIVDDAHRLDESLGSLARAIVVAKTVRLIVATRPQAREAVLSQLHRNGFSERIDAPLDLPRWKQADIEKLAENVLTPSHRLQAPRLAALADRCPLLVIIGGGLINSGTIPDAMTGEAEFRERVFKGFVDEFVRLQGSHKQERLRRLIRLLSFVTPTQKSPLLPKAAEILGCSPLDVAEDIEAIQAAGLVVANREGIRLYPDLFADAVLLDACLDQTGQASQLCQTILEKLAFEDFPSLIRNLAQADWESRTKQGTTNSIFDPIWKEFIRRFKAANGWVRSGLLRQWSPFAIFQPERTLELARLSLEFPEPSSGLLTELPALLKPVVVWHPKHASQGLEILWALDAVKPRENDSSDTNPITAISNAAKFEVHKARETSDRVLAWLEVRLNAPDGIERIRRQPWILERLLCPLFERAVEQSWSSGMTMHIRSVPVLVEATRPIRQRALKLAEGFACSGDAALAHASIPILHEGLEPLYLPFGREPTDKDHEQWRPDRLAVVAVLERAITLNRSAPVLLLRIRGLLWDRARYDPDPAVRQERERILSLVPDSFELRVARALTSHAQDEVHVEMEPDFSANYDAAERQWNSFCRTVAVEAASRFTSATKLCGFLRQQLHEIEAGGYTVKAGVILGPVAELSPEWSGSLLHELVSSEDPTLDWFMIPVFEAAASLAPERYRHALETLHETGRPVQLQALVNFLGWRMRRTKAVTQLERETLMKLAKRTESIVVHALASVAGFEFKSEPRWAGGLLEQLRPTGEREAIEVLEALVRLSDDGSTQLEPQTVARCFANLGELCLVDRSDEHHYLEKLGTRFPKQLYEHLRTLLDNRNSTDSALTARLHHMESLRFGPFDEGGYLENELQAQWQKALLRREDKNARLTLVRSLLWSDHNTAGKRLRRFMEQCGSGQQLEMFTWLAATPGSRFVFQFPDIVRDLLKRADELCIAKDVRNALWASACGGSRGFSGGELDQEYHYILQDAQELEKQHHEDAVLGPFYRLIIESEQNEMKQHREMFRTDDEELS